MKHTVEEVRLKNGSRGLLLDIPGSQVVNFSIGFRAGFLYSSPKRWEEPHLLEHTVFCANAEYDNSTAFLAEIEKNGASFGATTDPCIIHYSGEAADFEDERVLHLVNLAIATVKLKPNEVKTEIGNVQEELNMRLSEHDISTYEALIDKMTNQRTRKAGIESLKNITPSTLRKYHDNTHTTGNLRFIFGGNLKNKDKLLKQLESEMSVLKKGSQPEIPKQAIKNLDGPVVTRRDIPQIYYEIHHYFDPVSVSDWAVNSVITTVLAGRWKSWIFGEARRRGLAYHVGLGIGAEPHYSLLRIAAFVTPQNAEPLFKLISLKLQDLRDGKLTDKEIDEAKKYIVGSRLRAYKTPGALVNWYADDYYVHDTQTGFDTFLQQVQTVDKKMIQSFVGKMFDKPRWGVSLLGGVGDKKATQLHAILQRSYN